MKIEVRNMPSTTQEVFRMMTDNEIDGRSSGKPRTLLCDLYLYTLPNRETNTDMQHTYR